MSRIALSCIQRASREILPLDLALYHAARDYPGGAAAIAATTGRNPLFFQSGIASVPSIPPSACIPVLGPWSDLIVARVYACVVRDGGAMHGQTAETE